MNRPKLLLLTALAVACAGFLMLSQAVHAGHENLLDPTAGLSMALAR
jgi:hypothetical protein